MSGVTDIDTLLRSLSPELTDLEYVYCSLGGDEESLKNLQPLSTFRESEGLSLVISRAEAEQAGIPFESVFRLITLKVHSSLEAVGLTAAVAAKLASRGISANMVAACYHDHILVPSSRADEALAALRELGS